MKGDEMTAEYTLELILGEVSDKERKLHILNEYTRRKLNKIQERIKKKIRYHKKNERAFLGYCGNEIYILGLEKAIEIIKKDFNH